MKIYDNRIFYYERTDGKPICIGCKYMGEYSGCYINANDTTGKYPSACKFYNGLNHMTDYKDQYKKETGRTALFYDETDYVEWLEMKLDKLLYTVGVNICQECAAKIDCSDCRLNIFGASQSIIPNGGE